MAPRKLKTDPEILEMPSQNMAVVYGKVRSIPCASTERSRGCLFSRCPDCVVATRTPRMWPRTSGRW